MTSRSSSKSHELSVLSDVNYKKVTFHQQKREVQGELAWHLHALIFIVEKSLVTTRYASFQRHCNMKTIVVLKKVQFVN